MEKSKLIDIQKRFELNLSRINNLIKIYTDLGEKIQGRNTVEKSDLLRAAVIMLHASLEETMRGLAIVFWKEKDVKFLNNRVPFLSLDGNIAREGNKCGLGDLSQLDREMTIQNLLEESIHSYVYSKFTINDVKQLSYEIENVLGEEYITKLDLKNSNCEIILTSSKRGPNKTVFLHKELSNLFSRRHKIVHHTDFNDASGKGNHPTNSIPKKDLEKWIECVSYLVKDLLKESKKFFKTRKVIS